MNLNDSNDILALLEGFTLTDPDEIGKDIADDFRKRRIEKNLTRKTVAQQAGVALANVTRFEQKGLISLQNLIKLAMALGYTSEVHHLFSEQKYSTMEEMQQIKRNMGKKKAHTISDKTKTVDATTPKASMDRHNSIMQKRYEKD